jgi:RNA polymerase sigma-70 factor (ECF subfamily)
MPNHDAFQMTRFSHKSLSETPQTKLDIEQLLLEYYAYIHRLALSILGDNHEADDVAQETFIAAHISLPGFRNESSLKTWLSAIALNACRARLRKRRLRQVLNNTLQSLHLLKNSPPSPEQSAIQDEAHQAIWNAVDKLDDKHRFPVILYYVHEMNVPQIAALLQIREGTVHSRLHYSRKKLQVELQHLNTPQEAPDETSR